MHRGLDVCLQYVNICAFTVGVNAGANAVFYFFYIVMTFERMQEVLE